MIQYYDGILQGKFQKSHMSVKVDETGKLIASICFVANPGVRLSQKIKDELVEQTTAQFVDGWGESIFHKIQKSSDGTRYYIE